MLNLVFKAKSVITKFFANT